MSNYLGDFAPGQVVDYGWTSRDSTGTPSTLSGIRLAVSRANSTSSFSGGMSLTTDFGGIVGRNQLRITTASSSTQFLEGQDYHVFALAGQVGSVTTIAGEVICNFSVSNRFGGALVYGPLSGVPSTSQISLPSGASATNDLYNGAFFVAAVGPGQHQSRYISDYTGAGLFAQLDSALAVAVTSATTGIVYPGAPAVPGSVNSLVPGIYSGVTVGVNNIDPASAVTANVQSVNKTAVIGVGTDGDPWRASGT